MLPLHHMEIARRQVVKAGEVAAGGVGCRGVQSVECSRGKEALEWFGLVWFGLVYKGGKEKKNWDSVMG